jgi:O-acetyl-ADP-ribose deacetylase (regulator of RNase III)
MPRTHTPSAKIHVVVADITRMSVDAIVNAANPTLLGGGGVDGAIHRAAGPQLREACAALNGCAPGDAKVTQGFGLPANHVIHTVGPIWHEGRQDEDATLGRCYRRAIALADQMDDRWVAFPSISTGAYGFPIERAAGIATQALRDALRSAESVEGVVICCFSLADARYYRAALVAP